MGEPTAAEAATSERDILLATKLNVPGLRPDLVPRPRLAQRLDEGGRRGLVLACAGRVRQDCPAGRVGGRCATRSPAGPAAGGDPAGALNAMDEAVQAAPGPPGLLNPIPARRARLLLAQGDVAPDAGRGRGPAVPGLVDQLTSRELEVLKMLAAGQSNQAIASQLVVTLDTVKKHVSHVLGKLGAANRTEAVARARELSLIP